MDKRDRSLTEAGRKRVFILGPSHHYFLRRCAVSAFTTLDTPLGALRVDADAVAQLRASGRFDVMTAAQDEAEHSIELHLPYLRKMLAAAFPDAMSPDDLPAVVPVLVGATDPSAEHAYGRLLAPLLAEPGTFTVVSSDFCHWGQRFDYTHYDPGSSASGGSNSGSGSGSSSGSARSLVPGAATGRPGPGEPPVHDSIDRVDRECMAAVESGRHDRFLDVLRRTGNTVCGRHPIGLVLAALEAQDELGTHPETADGRCPPRRFRFVRYARSNDCVSVRDSSVSYCSALAVV